MLVAISLVSAVSYKGSTEKKESPLFGIRTNNCVEKNYKINVISNFLNRHERIYFKSAIITKILDILSGEEESCECIYEIHHPVYLTEHKGMPYCNMHNNNLLLEQENSLHGYTVALSWNNCGCK